MASPHSDNALAARTHHPKNPKAATEIQEDPELWRDIQANVRKMDDLYDATFYTWLRSEDNVLVTASYLQRLAGEYDLERIEHALCWLVNGWRLESIAILVKQVTFDWIVTKGDQGEMNRARLMLALTDNWAIQYIARLACTLLTSATVPPPPQPLFRNHGCDFDMHPLDTSMDISSTTMPTVQLHLAQSQYRPQPSHSHADYNDDMNSGLSRGCKSTDGNHQHCRAQTVEAIMLNSHGAGAVFSPSTSSSSSSSFSLTSASAASASLSTLSTLTLTESGMESSSSRPFSQPSSHVPHQQHHEQQHPHQQSLSSFTSTYSTPGLYRHATTMAAAPVIAPTSVATSAASAPVATSSSSSAANSLSIHSNGNQRHGHDSTSAKRKNSLGVSLTPPSHCSSFSPTSSSSTALHSSADGSLSSSSAIFPGPRRTSTSASTTNEDLKRLRCSRQNSTSSPSGI
ncbi:hypothetical protein BGZ70_009760 [Mortierella alpina]|uniref:Uncharacterized protein n=1 Tax=Mortierella alpina TaxID=64518 RepID=A0A9P6J2R0_MORAP|nr:hypothetical protein BGZ70_009760 [Mortierella alpina]